MLKKYIGGILEFYTIDLEKPTTTCKLVDVGEKFICVMKDHDFFYININHILAFKVKELKKD